MQAPQWQESRVKGEERAAKHAAMLRWRRRLHIISCFLSLSFCLRTVHAPWTPQTLDQEPGALRCAQAFREVPALLALSRLADLRCTA